MTLRVARPLRGEQLGGPGKEGSQAINPLESRWWLLVFPAAIMTITLLALNFVGDGLRDAFDVR